MPARAATLAAGLALLRLLLASPASGTDSAAGALPGLLHDVMPTAKRVAIVWTPGAAGGREDFVAAWDATRAEGLMPIGVEVRVLADLEPALAEARRLRSDALLVLRLAVGRDGLARLAGEAVERRWPALGLDRELVEVGGLMSLGSGGALVVNLKTARALGLVLPPAILQRASEVIP